LADTRSSPEFGPDPHRPDHSDGPSNDPGFDPEKALAAAARAAAKAARIEDMPGELDLSSIPRPFPFGPLAFAAAFIGSSVWLGGWAWVLATLVGVEGLKYLSPGEVVAYAVGIFSGVAFFWIIAFYARRGDLLRETTADLIRALQALTYPAEGSAARVSAITDSLRAQSEALTAASEAAAARLAMMEATFERQTRALSQTTEQARERTRDMRQSLEAEREALREVGERLAETADRTNQIAGKHLTALRDATEAATDATDAAATKLDSRARSLLDGLMAVIDETRKSAAFAKEEAEKLDAVARHGASQALEVAARYSEATGILTDATETAGSRAQRLFDLLSKQGDAIAGLSAALEAEVSRAGPMIDGLGARAAASVSRAVTDA
jgi:hypothetical protein